MTLLHDQLFRTVVHDRLGAAEHASRRYRQLLRRDEYTQAHHGHS